MLVPNCTEHATNCTDIPPPAPTSHHPPPPPYLRRLSMMKVPEVRVAMPTSTHRTSSMGSTQTQEMGMKMARA